MSVFSLQISTSEKVVFSCLITNKTEGQRVKTSPRVLMIFVFFAQTRRQPLTEYFRLLCWFMFHQVKYREENIFLGNEQRRINGL
jgi:hypothetical protein